MTNKRLKISQLWFLDILSKDQWQSSSIFPILYLYLKMPVLSCFEGSFVKFIQHVFGGIWQYNVEIRQKKKFLWSAVIVPLQLNQNNVVYSHPKNMPLLSVSPCKFIAPFKNTWPRVNFPKSVTVFGYRQSSKRTSQETPVHLLLVYFDLFCLFLLFEGSLVFGTIKIFQQGFHVTYMWFSVGPCKNNNYKS